MEFNITKTTCDEINCHPNSNIMIVGERSCGKTTFSIELLKNMRINECVVFNPDGLNCELYKKTFYGNENFTILNNFDLSACLKILTSKNTNKAIVFEEGDWSENKQVIYEIMKIGSENNITCIYVQQGVVFKLHSTMHHAFNYIFIGYLTCKDDRVTGYRNYGGMIKSYQLFNHIFDKNMTENDFMMITIGETEIEELVKIVSKN